MATTVRKNVFETNSSSSHSLVIEKEQKSGDIVINGGILNLNDLNDMIMYSGYDDENELIRCDTKNKKLAIACAVLVNRIGDIYDDWNKKEVEQLDFLKNKYNLTFIIGEVRNVWDEDRNLQTVIDNIDNDDVVILSKYENY
jgi:hypothetical protein